MTTPAFERVAIIGIGLIGSSLARVLRRDRLAGEIVACARRPETRAKALELGIVDRAVEDPAEAVAGADLVVVATPLSAYAGIAARIGSKLRPGAIVTDVGSVKQAVIRDLGPAMPADVHFIPGHPVAGTEHSGPESGFAELFRDRWCILTPLPDTDAAALARVTALWEQAGMKVVSMDAEHHDKVLAMTSHLPHVIAYTIVGTATDLEESLKSEVIKFSAGGFRDFTRIAGSDPVMWRDIFLNNREAVLEMLQRFSEDLTALQRAIRWGEGDKLEELFTRTRAIRRSIIEAKQA
ncbi:MAG: prephenate/arogenate dehydrogenase family protein [Alphaproteobacteria bacterium]|nr:prephenate/arogenate dehydrogenase family protein [Alphaproteobacteria bacterium]